MKQLRIIAGVLLVAAIVLAIFAYGSFISAPEIVRQVPVCDVCPAFTTEIKKDLTTTKALASVSVLFFVVHLNQLRKRKWWDEQN